MGQQEDVRVLVPSAGALRTADFGPLVWDISFLYGPDAVWEDIPEPLVISGYAIIARREDLENNLLQPLEEN